MAVADLLTYTDPGRRLTAAQWVRWENVGLQPTLDLDSLVLNWTDSRVSDLEAKGALVALSMARTMEGASTVTMTLRDPNGRLFSERAKRTRQKIDPTTARIREAFKRNPVEVDQGWDPLLPPDVLGRAVDVSLDGVVFRLVAVRYSTANQEAELTFEDRLVYWLKRKRGAKRASRAAITRAQFILSLLREVRAVQYRYVCPALNVRQPMAKAASTRELRAAFVTRAASTGQGSASGEVDTAAQPGGLAPNARVLVKGRAATAEQRRVGEQVLRRADAKGAAGKARLALMCAVIVESEVRNLTGGDADSAGVLQVRAGTARNVGISNRDVGACADEFLDSGFWRNRPKGAIELARAHPEWSAGKIAQETQGSAFPTRYDEVRSDAQTWVDAWSATSASSTSEWATKSYQFARNTDENSWEAMQRLASEVQWGLFVVGRSLYFMSEEELYRRRPRYQVTPDDPAVLDLTYSVDWGRPVSEATLTVALDRWGAPPGAVVVIDGYGPPDGRWLVSAVNRDWFSPSAEVTLKQPGKALLEPAAERTQRASNASGGQGTTVDSGSKAQTVYNAAKAISDKAMPYVWGGGHARAGTPSGGGYDCSGSTVAALAAAGLGYTVGGKVDVSGTIATSWGQSGKGRQLTVWANGQHVWIQFHDIGSAWRFDTSPYGSGDRGARLRFTSRPTAGFIARHWPGV